MGSDDYTFYFFLPRPDGHGNSQVVNVVRTENLTATTGTVTNIGPDSVAIGSQSLACRRYELRLADGDTRQFCVTTTGSLLQVTLPSSNLTATLTQAPSR